MSDCFHLNPLQHGGSSQDLRIVPALQPDSAPLDRRSMDDLILFMEKYGDLLNYYDGTNTIKGNWRPFFADDISTILASVSVGDYDGCLQTYYKYFDKIQNKEGILKEHVKVLFDIAFTLLDDVRRWNERLVVKSQAKEMIFREIDTRLVYDLRDLLLYYQAAQPDFVEVAFSLAPGTDEYVPLDSEDILNNVFKQEWWKKYNALDVISSWEDYLGPYLAPYVTSVTIFGDPAWSDDEKRIQYASSFLKAVFTNIYNAYVRIITTATKYFKDSITNYPSHSAHNGLAISFLHLFTVAQKELNKVTDRHLNFYYKDVLRINRRPPHPDSAHVVFALAKNFQTYTLEKGTALLGKDKQGNELVYTTDEVITINKSEVGALKSVFMDEDPASGGIYAAEVANSLDGKGKELDKEDPAWFGFGQPQASFTDPDKTMTEAAVGFFIAAPILQLSEGERTVTIKLNVASFGVNTFSQDELTGKLDMFVTGEKDWIALADITDYNTSLPDAIKITGSQVIIKFTLDEAMEAMVPFNPEAHKETYPTSWPIVKCLFKATTDIALYKKLASITISSIDISVDVSNAAACVLHSDQGSIDNKNPFMPFGPRPKTGSAFYFGSPEVFSKKIDSLTLKLSWLGTPVGSSFYDYYSYRKDTPSSKKSTGTGNENYIDLSSSGSTSSFTVSCKVKDGEEKNCTPSTDRLFSNGDDATINTYRELEFTDLFTEAEPALPQFSSFEPSLRRGFIKLSLTAPAKAFGHGVFNRIYTEQVIAVNSNSTNNSLPNEPYTPLLQPLVYDYSASETILLGEDNDPDKGQYFHVFPFGFTEQNQGMTPGFIYAFTHTDKEGIVHVLQGALHIGIKNIVARQLLCLYIEFSEGSEDASIDPPGVFWSYLSHNSWKELGDYIVGDSTNNFLGSGIVKIKVPDDMGEENSLMPPGMKWIRVSVPGYYSAYPKVYAVYTNAVRATYASGDASLIHLAEPLPASSITKLQMSQAAVKKVLQYHESFDGRTTEGNKKYYTRVSERLRHKHRAITIWDYERLILEEFQYLYKVKCLNHTNEVTETAPGSVRIITIPDMSAKSTGNLFKPMISNNKRQLISDYIRKLNCPFADLQVQNPQYEAIKVKCEVKIMEGLDETAYIEKLKEDIDRFLAPWAFDAGRDIGFGGSIHRSQIIYYIEKLGYVDFVTDFLMDLHLEGSVLTDLEEAKATTSKSVLTSYRDHQIGTNVCVS